MDLGAGGKLEYFLSEKGEFLVVVLIGSITKANASAFDRCAAEVLRKGSRKVVLAFRDVEELDQASIPPFTRFQKAVRETHAGLHLCGLKPELRRVLEERGAIRREETFDNLTDALQSFRAGEGSGGGAPHGG